MLSAIIILLPFTNTQNTGDHSMHHSESLFAKNNVRADPKILTVLNFVDLKAVPTYNLLVSAHRGGEYNLWRSDGAEGPSGTFVQAF